MDFRNRHVVITGGTGALGGAVVGALIEAGAVCHVPYISATEAERFALRDHDRVRLTADVELTNEAAVASFYNGIPKLGLQFIWSAALPWRRFGRTTKAELMARSR